MNDAHEIIARKGDYILVCSSRLNTHWARGPIGYIARKGQVDHVHTGQLTYLKRIWNHAT